MKKAEAFYEALREELRQRSELQTVGRDTMLTRAGEVENRLYLIEAGAVRAFYVSESEEHTIRFGYRNSLINSLASWVTGAPSELYLQAIRKTSFFALPKAGFEQFLQQPGRAEQFAAVMSLFAVEQMEREIDLLTASPLQRLRRVEQRSPRLFQEVPLRYIASYLRMSPETLSRIRKS